MMEPEAGGCAANLDRDPASAATIAAVSIAISLKRIADALSYQPVGSKNLFDYIHEISERRP